MTNYERETIINFNEAEKTASVYTCNRRMIAKLNGLSEKFPEQFALRREFSDGAKEYTVPKKYVSIKAPRPKMSDDEKAELVKRLLKGKNTAKAN